MVPVFRRNSDSHISATAYHNMGLFFSPGPFHYLFLTALVHPLSTCAYLLLLSHCNNYILPSHSRQQKLASCFILSSGWGIFPIAPFFLQPACFSMSSGWSISSHCATFPQPACSDACAWLVAPDNPAGFRLHITGTSSPLRSNSVSVIPQIHAFACKQACSDACAWGIITQKSPRAMWSSAGLLEKGVDYKFHVREFMFRCG